MYDTLRRLLESERYSVIESFVLAPRPAVYAPVPQFLFESRVGQYLEEGFARGVGLWRHQTEAIDALGKGRNVVVPTGTASGKSLIFRAVAFHRILMEPESRVLVFYPLKALASDQLRGWQTMAAALRLPPEVIGRIDGSVDMRLRDGILGTARIVLMTPDVCHAWLMSRLSITVAKEFLARLVLLVMDEAHTLDGVFGSNFAFLVRCLLAARQHLQRTIGAAQPLQFVAATATIANPTESLSALTGAEFDLIPEPHDGSPRSERVCAHIAAPPGQELVVARALHADLLKATSRGGFITFVGSRKGVELLARANKGEVEDLLVSASVVPYRAGYDAQDREAIEQRLQVGTLRGVVSTSALELGIDLPHLRVGLNVGVPGTRKAYRQRLGRVGRSSPGAFVVIAHAGAFTGFGTTFREYHDLSVEDSYLYLDNRFMQFAHARCLAEELEALGTSITLPGHARWPGGFAEVFGWAKPGGSRPPEFDGIAQLGGDSPQRGYPLRNVGEINFKIARGESADHFGDINESQALRECYPGATYLHIGRAWEVVAWHTNAFTPFIRMKPGSAGKLTKPRIRTWINAGITTVDLMEQHLRRNQNSFLAECQMQVTEKVEGFEDLGSGTYRAYSELRQQNPSMRPRTRNFRTSGVILSIDKPWFRNGRVRQQIADRLTAVFAREYSVLPQDIGSAATNISVRSLDGGGPRDDCIVVFDQTYGSLRLTERLFLNFGHLLGRLERAVQAEGGGGDRDLCAVVQLLLDTTADLIVGTPDVSGSSHAAPGYLQVFTSGSRVFYREKGKVGSEVEIIQPTLMNGKLMYQVQCVAGRPGYAPTRQWISADFIEPSAESGEWEYASWNTSLERFEDSVDDGADDS